MTHCRASPVLRAMISKAAWLPIGHKHEEPPKFVTIVRETINGDSVEIRGRYVERNTLDGPAPVFLFTSHVNGIRLNRTQLYVRFGERC